MKQECVDLFLAESILILVLLVVEAHTKKDNIGLIRNILHIILHHRNQFREVLLELFRLVRRSLCHQKLAHTVGQPCSNGRCDCATAKKADCQ